MTGYTAGISPWAWATYTAAGFAILVLIGIAGVVLTSLALKVTGHLRRARQPRRETQPFIAIADFVINPEVERHASFRAAQASDGIGDDAVTVTCEFCPSGRPFRYAGFNRCTCKIPCGESWCGAGAAA